MPAAVKSPTTGEELYTTESIKIAVNDHVAATLKDEEPAERYRELALLHSGRFSGLRTRWLRGLRLLGGLRLRCSEPQ